MAHQRLPTRWMSSSGSTQVRLSSSRLVRRGPVERRWVPPISPGSATFGHARRNSSRGSEGSTFAFMSLATRSSPPALNPPPMDYRYGSRDGVEAQLSVETLDAGIAERCRLLAGELGLRFAGIDLRADEDDVWCLEVNPAPAFSYYEAHTGQPIARAVARLLVSGEGAREAARRSGRSERLESVVTVGDISVGDQAMALRRPTRPQPSAHELLVPGANKGTRPACDTEVFRTRTRRGCGRPSPSRSSPMSRRCAGRRTRTGSGVAHAPRTLPHQNRHLIIEGSTSSRSPQAEPPPGPNRGPSWDLAAPQMRRQSARGSVKTPVQMPAGLRC